MSAAFDAELTPDEEARLSTFDCYDGVAAVLHYATEASRFAKGGLTGGSLNNAVYALAQIAEARRYLLGVEDAITGRVDELAREAGHRFGDVIEVDGIGTIRLARTRTTTWRNEDTLAALIDAHMTKAGGVLPDDPAEVARWITDAVGVDWRVTALRDAGVDPDADDGDGPLRSVKRGRLRVHLTDNRSTKENP